MAARPSTFTTQQMMFLLAITAANPYSTPPNHLKMSHLSRHQPSNKAMLNPLSNAKLTSWMSHLLLPGTCLRISNTAASETENPLPCGVERILRLALHGGRILGWKMIDR